MASYNLNNSLNLLTLTSSYKTALVAGAVTGATTLRRIWWTEIEWGATDVPNASDCPILLLMQKFTAAGTTTAATPGGTDGLIDAAALGTYGLTASGEPTYTTPGYVFFKSINQRASDKQWWRDKATCPISPAVTANGIGAQAKSPNYASTFGFSANVEE